MPRGILMKMKKFESFLIEISPLAGSVKKR